MPKQELTQTDKRILEQQLKKHEISRVEYQKALKELPDESENAEELVVHEGHEAQDIAIDSTDEDTDAIS